MHLSDEHSPAHLVVLMVGSILMLPVPLFLAWPCAVLALSLGPPTGFSLSPLPGLVLGALLPRRVGVLAIPFIIGAVFTAAYYWVAIAGLAGFSD